jgi:hypothetical protein
MHSPPQIAKIAGFDAAPILRPPAPQPKLPLALLRVLARNLLDVLDQRSFRVARRRPRPVVRH